MSITIALAGNPNSGKTTLYNALTGSSQFVGNWPGVTVEKKEGLLKQHDDVKIVDLPGVYSLSPYTLEEVVARDYLIGERPDAILNIIDGTNLERNLFLTTQLIELGIPVVAVINMMDVVIREGDLIDTAELSRQLGCKVVPISAIKNDGIFVAAEEAIKAAAEDKAIPHHNFSGAVEHALAHIEEAAVHDMPLEQQRWYAIKIFERDEKVLSKLSISADTLKHMEEDIQAAEKELEDDSESIITNERYIYIASIIDSCYVKNNRGSLSVSDKIDMVVTNRWLGFPIFILIMVLVYSLSMAPNLLGNFLSERIDIMAFWENILDAFKVLPWLKSLILDGIISGVGAVLSFVPQLLVIFFLLAFLEACGYMARIAFVMDRIFRKFGLSGKSFIPIIVGTGCGVPGIMATRTIENDRDRRMTIMVTTFIPCGAKIPIIAMIAGAFFGGSPVISVGAYFLGMAAIIVSGIILKKTKRLRGNPAPFVMELPPYHMPSLSNVLRSTFERGWSFVKKAGTIILLSTIIMWFLSNFGMVNGSFTLLSENEMNLSILANLGSVLAFVFSPLGFGSWQASVASLTGLVSKENIVGTMGILYGGSDGADLYQNLRNVFSPLSGFSFLIFNLLCAPCFAAIGAIRSEMNDRGWTAFAIFWQCGFAYAVSLIIYQVGSVFTGNVDVIFFPVAVLVLGIMIYALFFKKAAPADAEDEMEKTLCVWGCDGCHLSSSCEKIGKK